jgi:predicted aspartyl protease
VIWHPSRAFVQMHLRARSVLGVQAAACLAAITFCCGVSNAQPTPPPDTRPVIQREETIDFFRAHNGLILIPVGLEGKVTATFVLDTGAQGCAISSKLANELKLPRRSMVTADGKQERLPISGKGNSEIATAKLLQLGAMVFEGAPFVVADPNRLPSGDGVEIDGIIGMRLLELIAFKLDYSSKKMTLWHPGNLNDLDLKRAGIPVTLLTPAEYRDGQLLARGLVNGKFEESFLVDTGSGSSCVSEETAKRAGLKKEKRLPQFTVKGVIDFDFVRLDTLSVGAITLSSPLVGVLRKGVFNVPAGILGLDVLERTILFVDASGKRFYAGLKAKEVAK